MGWGEGESSFEAKVVVGIGSWDGFGMVDFYDMLMVLFDWFEKKLY